MENKEKVDPIYLEKLILKRMLEDHHYSIIVANSFLPEYFDQPEARKIFQFIFNHTKEFNKLPDWEIVQNSVSGIEDFLNDIQSIELDLDKNDEWLLTNTNQYLQEKAVKDAIIKSVEVVEGGGDYTDVRGLIEDALTKDLQIDLGLDYWEDLGERLKLILLSNDERIPTYFPFVDEILNGGFPTRGLLGCIVGETGAGKTLTAINFAARQVLNGHDVVVFTMEIDEESYAMRADGIYSGLDVNRMYITEESIATLFHKLKEVRQTEKMGKLIIKDFPTGRATVNDFIIFLRELKMRGIKPSIIYVDYIGIMRGKFPQNPYLNIKYLAEELRAFAIQFGLPVITFHQLNREGRRATFRELSGIYIAESAALEHTADLLGLIGIDEDRIIYENTLFLKWTKNRISGRKGSVLLYIDFRSLKMYSEDEMDVWMKDAKISGDSRNAYDRGNE